MHFKKKKHDKTWIKSKSELAVIGQSLAVSTSLWDETLRCKYLNHYRAFDDQILITRALPELAATACVVFISISVGNIVTALTRRLLRILQIVSSHSP